MNRRSTALLALMLAAATTAGAGVASLEVTVRERQGRTLAGCRVSLLSFYGSHTRTRWVPSRRPLTTGSDGRAAFADLQPGTYSIDVVNPRRPDLVRPRENPFTPATVITLEEDQQQRIEIELWRGTLINVGLVLPDDGHAGFVAHFHHRETGRTLRSGFRHHVETVSRRLAPGMWEVSVEPRPGYLLVDVTHDRLTVDSHAVTLDLTVDPRDTYLTWTYTAPAEIYGSVVDLDGRQPSATIEASLVRPGPWIAAAERRGGSQVRTVTAIVDPKTGDYEMVVPDGDWAVRPTGETLIESDPEMVALTLVPGQSGRADFAVHHGGAPGSWLYVAVEDAERNPVRGARVEVYAADDTATATATPITRGVVEWGVAQMPAPPLGDYLVVAGHPDYLEGSVELPDYDPDAERPVAPEIVLRPGAIFRVRAADVEKRPVAGLETTIERLDEPPAARLRNPDVAAARARRTLRTDLGGRARAQGFYAGRYLLTARLHGTRGVTDLFLLRRAGGDFVRDLEVGAASGETIEIEVLEVAAASLHAELACGDAWPLPEAVSVRVVRATAEVAVDRSGRSEPTAGVALALDGVLLSGKHRDVLQVGPLEPGAYRLAVRPSGFDRWTWAYETYDVRESFELPVATREHQAERRIDLGSFELECGPAVDLLPEVLTGEPFPDLHRVEVAARVLDPEEEREIAPPLLVVRDGDRLRLRGLPRGPQRLVFNFTHPHLLPAPTLEWHAAFELERGQLHELAPQVEALGGAIEVRAGATRAVLTGTDGGRREQPLAQGKALLASLVPGVYRLELHGAGDGPPLAVWPALEVRAGETVRRSGPGSDPGAAGGPSG